MKTISMIQPWGSLVARGQKTIETRTWRTSYRGDLLFAAGQKIDRTLARALAMLDAPRGVALCVARLVDVRPMRVEDVPRACMDFVPRKDWPELVEGRFAWVLEDAREVEPFPIKGKLSLFEVPDELVRIRGAS